MGVADKYDLQAREMFRLIALVNENDGNLLDDALEGAPKTKESLVKMFNFLRRMIDGYWPEKPFVSSGSKTLDRYWEEIHTYLVETGVSEDELAEIKKPLIVVGQGCILDEFED